jgi:hypothetical protein
MWIRKEIQALLWKNYTSLKWCQSHCEVTLPENADTSVDRIKAFLRTQLPLSAEMAINRHTFGGEDVSAEQVLDRRPPASLEL